MKLFSTKKLTGDLVSIFSSSLGAGSSRVGGGGIVAPILQTNQDKYYILMLFKLKYNSTGQYRTKMY